MPIVITLTPGRVEQVSFTGFTPAQRAIETALWPAIAPLVDELDGELRRINDAVLRGLEREGEN
jgi:hypothetical protein